MGKNITRHVSHLKSSGTTAPQASDLLYGEIAVGYGAGTESLYIKNSSGAVVSFTSAAGAEALAELYTDRHVISTVNGDSEISVSLNAIEETGNSGRTLTITHASGSAQSGFKKLESDSYGHITGGSNVTLADLTGLGALSAVTGASGISVSAKANGQQTISHSNSVTAGTAKTSSTSVTVTPSGNNIVIPSVTYDAQGHVTSTGTTNVSLKVDSATTSTAGIVKIAIATGSNNTDTVMTQKAVSDELATKALKSAAIADVEYNSTDKKIYFKNADGGQVDFISTDDFVKDGMISGVTTETASGTTWLVITWNTDAGHEVTRLDIGDLFEADNYYTKAEVQDIEEVISSSLNDLNSRKADASVTVTANSGLTGGGNLSSNITISHVAAHSATGQTSPNAAQTPSFGSTFNVPVVKYDVYGHVTGTTTTTVTIPSTSSTWTENYYITGATTTTAASQFNVALNGNNTAAKASFTIPSATTSAAGVMSSADKTKLNGISTGATKTVLSNAKTAGDTTLATLTIDGTATTIKADNKSLTINAGSTTVSTYAPSEAKTLTFSGDDAVSVSGSSTNNIVIKLENIECGDYA